MASAKANHIYVLPYHPYDYDEVYDFIYHHKRLHVHLEWSSVSEWLRDLSTRTMIARDSKGICGMLSFTNPHNDATWLRLLAIEPKKINTVLPLLWENMKPNVRVKTLASTVREEWFAPIIESLGFRQSDLIINLVRKRQPVPKLPLAMARILPVADWELEYMLELDHAAFSPLWQLTESDLQAAERRAEYYMGAYDGVQNLGYLIAMRYGDSIHLARLAVDPEFQNRGIGRMLVYDLVCKAEGIKAEQITVNTQLSNLSSQRLYQKFGFERDYKDIPVYTMSLR